MEAEDSAIPASSTLAPAQARVYALPHLRPATPADAGALVDLLATVGVEGTLGLDASALRADDEAARLAHLDLRFACALVVVMAGRVCGAAIAVRGAEPAIAHTATVSVAVAAEARRRGCGSLLLGGVLAWARAAGVSKLCAGVIDRNDAALALFHRAGYDVEGIRRGQIATGGRLADEIVFGLQVEAAAGPERARPRRGHGEQRRGGAR